MRLNIVDASSTALRLRSPALAAPVARLRESVGTLTLILTLAFVVRIVWIALSGWSPTPSDDAYRYDLAARGLADGLGYLHTNGAPTAFWPPGYPLLLAGAYSLFGQHVEVAQALNALLGTATVGLVYVIGRRLFGHDAALIAAAIVAFFPSLVFFTAVTLSEISFTFLALLAILLVLIEAQAVASSAQDAGEGPPAGSQRRLQWLLLAGLVLGLASLVRGQALLLPLVLIPFWLRSGIDRRGIAHGLVALFLGIGLIVAPWSVRNAVQMHEPVLIATNAGVDFWIGHHDSADGSFGASGGNELVYRYPELSSPAREVRVNNDGFREGLTYAVTHPQEELVLPFKKLFWLYHNDEEGLRWNEGHGGQPFLAAPLRSALLATSNIYYFAVLGLLLLGVPLWLSVREPGRVLLISLILYWTLIHLAFFGDPRFHAPVMPIVALLAALPLAALHSGSPRESRPPPQVEAESSF